MWAMLKWVAAFLAAMWVHDVPAALKMLVVFQAADYLTGIYAALVTKQLSSRVALVGFARKGMILFSVMFSHQIEILCGQILQRPVELNLETWGAIGFALSDCISLVENLARGRVPIPAKLVDMLMIAKSIAPKFATEEQLRKLDELNHNYAGVEPVAEVKSDGPDSQGSLKRK